MSHDRKSAAYLANIAYVDEAMDPLDYKTMKADFVAALAAMPTPATPNCPWTLVWGPALNDGLLLYVARGADGSLCLSFRGTNVDGCVRSVFDNVYFDLDVYDQVLWQYDTSTAMYVAAGTNTALSLAMAARDPATGTTVVDYLKKAGAAGADITVTGHSLGGGLAIVGAAFLKDQLPVAGGGTFNLFPYTFAAPTICDSNFATFFRQAFPSYYAAVNLNDIVPMAWANLDGILDTFSPDGPWIVWDDPGLAALIGTVAEVAPTYTAIVAPVQDDWTQDILGDGDMDWDDVADAMHSMQNTYLPYVTGEASAPLQRGKRRVVPRNRVGLRSRLVRRLRS